MIRHLGLGLGAAVLVAAFSAAARHVVLEVRALRTDLAASCLEIDRLRASAGEPREASPLPDGREREIDGLHRDILEPSVQVNARGGVGGGTILSSGPSGTWVVTAYHVVQKSASGDPPSPAEVRIYDATGAPADTLLADLVAFEQDRDLALLRLRDERRFANVARLAGRPSLRNVRVFTPVYAVGCPLGHDPLPTLGEIVTLNKEVSGRRFWMMNAPTIFGNSGGGIFHRDTRELVGVSAMICTYDGAVSTPVPHLGILVSLDAVYDWLESLGLGYVVDPSASVEACEAARAAWTTESGTAAVLPRRELPARHAAPD
ncbi:MAG TPA: serine protease [Planctomycetota bacterium]|nr:serine protease [Planctomycetota bacterium]